MKKLLAIILAVAMVLSVAAPAFASTGGIGTGVTITGSSGDPPVVLAKWETPDSKPTDNTPPTQIAPNATYQGTSPIEFWVVVFKNPITAVSLVSVDVFHPQYPLLPDPRVPGSPPQEGAFKFEVILTPYLNALSDGVIGPSEAQAALDAYEDAVDDGLVTQHALPFGNGVPATETVAQMIAQGEAYLWYGCYVLEYHQPAGIYLVDAFAKATGPVDEDSHLLNNFEYVAVTAFEADFTSINYGPITTDGVVSGDSIFAVETQPTFRNIGNTWFNLQIQQDDMGFGITEPGSVWNVQYDARIGSLLDYPMGGPSIGGPTTVYSPAFQKGARTTADPTKWTTLPGTVHLCNTWKIDFSIHIIKSINSSYSGTMWLQAQYVPFDNRAQVNHPGQSNPS